MLLDGEESEMLLEISQYRFAALEMALYLDTHPNDVEALQRHNHFCEVLKEKINNYQYIFNNPLDLYQPVEGKWWTYIDWFPWISASDCEKGKDGGTVPNVDL